MNFLKRLFEPTVWKVIGQSPIKRGELTSDWGDKGILTYRIYIIQNQHGKRDIKVNALKETGSVVWHDWTIIDANLSCHNQRRIRGKWSTEKVNSVLETQLLSYEEAKFTESDYLNNYVEGESGKI